MKLCQVCKNSSASEAPTCPYCGEASWAGAEVAPTSPMAETIETPMAVEIEPAPTTESFRGRKGRRT